MKTTENRTAFLLALVLPTLLAGCKPYTSLYDALTSAAETSNASNPFVGLWEASVHDGFSNRHIYMITDDKRWERYVIINGAITPDYIFKGTYTYKGSILRMTFIKYSGDVFSMYPGTTTFPPSLTGSAVGINIKANLDGDILKIGRTVLHRVSTDCSNMKQILEKRPN